VGGIFCGSMLWWVTLVLLVNRFRDRFDERAMKAMNHIAGIAIGGFGVATFLIGIRNGR
jgi:threonine/homoserine/homoserine lactone efflux protein